MIFWTAHARQRAAERFPEACLEELEEAYLRSKRPGKNLRKQIRKLCPVANRLHMAGQFKGRYWRVAKKIVFVVQTPDTIVTIFPLGQEG
jgi:hypothetical protein